MKESTPEKLSPLKERLHEIIFEADTREGRLFDIVLITAIIISVLVVLIESIPSIHDNPNYHNPLYAIEWVLTIFFTIEYLLRIYIVLSPRKYMTSFFGIIDLLAILPTYLSLFIEGTSSLMVIRALRLLRVFRIFKLASFMKEGRTIIKALRASRAKLTVFLVFVLLMVTIVGSIMYLVEGTKNSEQFSSIPESIYWAIVTLTTVGYGDISPVTPFGQFLAAIVMILGYAVIAVPTGIVSAEIVNGDNKEISTNTQACRSCSEEGHDDDAEYCKYCGFLLNEPKEEE